MACFGVVTAKGYVVLSATGSDVEAESVGNDGKAKPLCAAAELTKLATTLAANAERSNRLTLDRFAKLVESLVRILH